MTRLSGLFYSMAEMKNSEKMAITTEEPHVISNSEPLANHVQTNDVTVDSGDNSHGTAGVNNSNNGNGHQKKKTSSFQITRVIKPTERPTTRVSDHDGDEPEELDETNTDEVSMASENLDASKGMELDENADGETYASAISSEDLIADKGMFLPLSSTSSLASNTIYHIPQNKAGNDTSFMSLLKPISETQAQVVMEDTIPEEPSEENLKLNESRFKVVKIESELPFRRGRWACFEYRSERNDGAEDASGNSSTASSVYYTQDAQDPDDNLRNLPMEFFQNGDHVNLPIQGQDGKHIILNSQMPTQSMPTTVPITFPTNTMGTSVFSDTNSQAVQAVSSKSGTDELSPTAQTVPVSKDTTKNTSSFTTSALPTRTTATVTNANDFRPEREGFSNISSYPAVPATVAEHSTDKATHMPRNLASALMRLRASQDYSVSNEMPSQTSVPEPSSSNSPTQHSSSPTQAQRLTADASETGSQADAMFQAGQNNSLDSSDRDSVTSNEGEGLPKTMTPSLQLFNFVGKRDEER